MILDMNVYVDKKYSHQVETYVLYHDDETKCYVVECADLYYVIDDEGDAQRRGQMQSTALRDLPDAMTLLAFLKLEMKYAW